MAQNHENNTGLQSNALLIEAIAGAGKSTHLAKLAKDYANAGHSVLILSFSQSGCRVLEKYLAKIQADTFDNIRVITIEQLAKNLLEEFGILSHYLSPKRVVDEVLFDLLQTQAEDETDDMIKQLPRFTVENLYRFKRDIDTYRYSQSYLLQDIQDVSVAFHTSADLARYLFELYEKHRRNWQDPYASNSGKYGFFTVSEICYDFLELAEYEASLSEKWQVDCILIDEFHDLSPLHLAVVKKIVQLIEASKAPPIIVAVGDRRQNLYEWRDGTFDSVFDEFITYFSAQRQCLYSTYRFGATLAERVGKLIHCQIDSLADHDTSVCYRDQLPSNLDHSNLIITDAANLTRLAFALLTRGIPVAFDFKNDEIAYFFDGLLQCRHDEEVEKWLRQIIDDEAQLFTMLESYRTGLLIHVLSSLQKIDMIVGSLSDRAFLKGLYAYVSTHYPLLTIQDWSALYAYLRGQANTKVNYSLYTVANAKGREFERVILCFPYEENSNDSEQYRLNLKYVAVTRAKKALTLLTQPV